MEVEGMAINIGLCKHGTRGRFVQGCRCDDCREANRIYYRKNQLDRIYGRNDPLVDASGVRAHLEVLKKASIGLRTVSQITGKPRSSLSKIRQGTRKMIKRSDRDAIMGIDPNAILSDATLVDASPTWKLIDELLELGWTRGRIAREALGAATKTLQLNEKRVTARNERKIRIYHSRMMVEVEKARSSAELKDNHWIARHCFEEWEVPLHLRLKVCTVCQADVLRPPFKDEPALQG